MSSRYRRYTNLFGHQVEFSSELLLPYSRYFRRESKSQKSQYNSQSMPPTHPGKKRPMDEKLNK
jgi:hypothetical protein